MGIVSVLCGIHSSVFVKKTAIAILLHLLEQRCHLILLIGKPLLWSCSQGAVHFSPREALRGEVCILVNGRPKVNLRQSIRQPSKSVHHPHCVILVISRARGQPCTQSVCLHARGEYWLHPKTSAADLLLRCLMRKWLGRQHFCTKTPHETDIGQVSEAA